MQRKKYSKEFKQEAVELTRYPGLSVAQVAHELGINANMLGRWRRNTRRCVFTKCQRWRATTRPLAGSSTRACAPGRVLWRTEGAFASEKAALLRNAIEQQLEPVSG